MTFTVDFFYDGTNLRPVHPEKLGLFKKKLKKGIHLYATFDDGVSSAQSPLAKRYFATRDEYATVNGYTTEHAHVELKALYGVCYDEADPPQDKDVRLVEYHGQRMWQLSIRDYTSEQLQRLVEGSSLALDEASV